MTVASDAPNAQFIIAQVIGVTACLLTGFLNVPEWTHTPLGALAIGAFIYAALLAIKTNKARQDWLKMQSDYVDPYQGGPEYPTRKESAAKMTGICSFIAFTIFALPMMDRDLSSNDWWVVVPLLLMIAGFGYAQRVRKKYSVALAQWRESQKDNDNAQKPA